MDDNLKTIEDSFDAIPPEVKEYIYSDDFDSKLDAIFVECNIDNEKKKLFKGALFGFIAQVEDEESVLDAINTTSSDNIVRQKIKDWVDIHISQKILSLITEGYIKEEEDAEQQPAVVSPTTNIPSSALSTLSDRLKQASIATSAKREYVSGKDTSTPPARVTIDPYHEPVDNG